jgi:hypothetical protein
VTRSDIAWYRLLNQQIATTEYQDPADVVSALGAMQGQDYLGTLWAIGLRLPVATQADVEAAIAKRAIVRTWSLRGTLHFMAAADVHWLLELLGPRTIAGAALRHEGYGLDKAVFRRIRSLFVQALQGEHQLTRDEMYTLLARARISIKDQYRYHILWQMGLERVICFGARKGKQPTYTLLDEWAPQVRKLDHEAALAELTYRYFKGHGPATLEDFVWWSGLKISDAKAGLAMVSSRLQSLTVNDKVYWMDPAAPSSVKKTPIVHLLPGFDEYLLGYRDRTASLDPADAQKTQPGSNGMFSSTIVIDGKVVGTWKREVTKKALRIDTNLFRPLTKKEALALKEAFCRYSRFLGVGMKGER